MDKPEICLELEVFEAVSNVAHVRCSRRNGRETFANCIGCDFGRVCSRLNSAAALDAWSDCVLRAVAQLDDGKTDPLSIAHGVAPRCAALYADATQSAVQGMITEKGQAHTRLLYKDNELRLITNAVLTSRAAKRS